MGNAKALEFMSTAPRPLQGNTAWASAYGYELRRVVREHASRAPRSLQSHLGPSELGVECLTGETEVVTRTGIRRISDLAAEGHAELLVPMLYEGSEVRKKWGRFLDAPVECLGEQEIYEVVLRRNQERKFVRATAGHRWFRTFYSGKRKTQETRTTVELKPGHKLTQLRRAMPRSTTLMHWAVTQGFTFGDGTTGSSDDKHRPARLYLYHNGKDEAMLRFFPGEWPLRRSGLGNEHYYSDIRGLPRLWKSLPPLDESVSFLMSWLAGYFAADGCVTEDGHCSITSAQREHLEFVRSLAAICGVGYGQIQKHHRIGINQDHFTTIYRLSLRRRDFPSWFFLQDRHAERAEQANQVQERDPHWLVESVTPTGTSELVYCARVEGVGAFGLADDLMTGNCDRQVVGKMAATARTNHVIDPWASVVGTAVHAWLADAFAGDNERHNQVRWIPEQRVTPHPNHPGTADLYDAYTQSVVDHKALGPTSMSKVMSPDGPPRKYVVQLLLYGRGYKNLGLPVQRVVLAAYPRTSHTLDGLYVWERPSSPEDDVLIEEVFRQTEIRRALAAQVRSGQLHLNQIPKKPDDYECAFCPFWRPQARYDNGPGCPGRTG